jgi:hypothetical protein
MNSNTPGAKPALKQHAKVKKITVRFNKTAGEKSNQ